MSSIVDSFASGVAAHFTAKSQLVVPKIRHCLAWRRRCSPKRLSRCTTFLTFVTSSRSDDCWEDLGATVLTPELRTYKITAAHVEVFEAPYELVKTMRASVLALGLLISAKRRSLCPAVVPSARGRSICIWRGFEKFGADLIPLETVQSCQGLDMNSPQQFLKRHGFSDFVFGFECEES